jgi:hypothetical protein
VKGLKRRRYEDVRLGGRGRCLSESGDGFEKLLKSRKSALYLIWHSVFITGFGCHKTSRGREDQCGHATYYKPMPQ